MKKALLTIIVVLGLFLGGCGPGTAEAIYYESLDVFAEKFGGIFAFPTYYPAGFNPKDSGVTVKASAALTREAHRHQPRNEYKNYKGFDIFAGIGFSLSRETDMNAAYSNGEISMWRPMNVDSSRAQQEYKEIPGNRYGAKIYEYASKYFDYETKTSYEDHTKEHWLNVFIRIPLDEVEYSFYFMFHMNPVDDDDAYAAIREEIRGYCIEEAMKMYESLAYAE